MRHLLEERSRGPPRGEKTNQTGGPAGAFFARVEEACHGTTPSPPPAGASPSLGEKAGACVCVRVCVCTSEAAKLPSGTHGLGFRPSDMPGLTWPVRARGGGGGGGSGGGGGGGGCDGRQSPEGKCPWHRSRRRRGPAAEDQAAATQQTAAPRRSARTRVMSTLVLCDGLGKKTRANPLQLDVPLRPVRARLVAGRPMPRLN